jgi:hypothetical protein
MQPRRRVAAVAAGARWHISLFHRVIPGICNRFHAAIDTPSQGMDGLVVFIDSCAASDVKCDWKQNFKPAPMAPVIANILHVTNQLNPLARIHAQQLVEELQHNPALIRSACTLMLRLGMTASEVLEEWRTHSDRQSDPLGPHPPAPEAQTGFISAAGTMDALLNAPKHAAALAPAQPLLDSFLYPQVHAPSITRPLLPPPHPASGAGRRARPVLDRAAEGHFHIGGCVSARCDLRHA